MDSLPAKVKLLENLQDFSCFGRKIIGVELNYKSAAIEQCVIHPKKPVFFIKPVTAYIREPQMIRLPNKKIKVSHGVCLGVVIGRQCRCVCKEGARVYIGGYCLALDLTACSINDPYNRGKPWLEGKGFDTSCPISRFIHAARVPDPQNLEFWCNVNGRIRQKCTTSNMIFTIEELISEISMTMTLEPYDLILTGTPSGVGLLQQGDVVECGLTGYARVQFTVASDD